MIGDALLLRHAAGHAVELVLVGAARDAEFEPAAGQVVAKRGLAGEPDRRPIGRNQRRGAEPDAVGMLAQPGQRLEGIGRDRALDRVMLGGPQRLEAAFVGHPGEGEQLLLTASWTSARPARSVPC
jgi:hypothetical protein